MVILSAGSSATTFNAAARSTHRRTGQLRWRYGTAVDSPARERTHSHSVRQAVNEDEVYSALAAATEGYGGVVRFARRTGIGRTYVSRMLSGNQRVSVAVAGRLGFELRWVRRNSRNTEAQS